MPDSKKIVQPNDLEFKSRAAAKKAKKVRTGLLESPNDEARITELITDMAPFVNIGMCYRPQNNTPWDLLFDLQYGGDSVLVCIECVLWTKTVGLPLMFPYYMKACLNDFKLSILVCRKAQILLFGDNAAETHTKKAKVEESDPKSNTEPDATQLTFERKLIDYWRNEEEKAARNEKSCRINIYTIKFNNKSRDRTTKVQNGTFTFGTLKEFANPTGVFLIVESNFKPPKRK